MPATRWVDRSQPQTLMIATILLYVNGVLDLIYGVLFPVGLIVVVGQILAGWAVANQKRWGYWLAVVLSVLMLLVVLVSLNIINLIFQVALVALLLHPQSREYKRIWFR